MRVFLYISKKLQPCDLNEQEDLKAANGFILAGADTKAPYKYLTYKLSKSCKHFVVTILPRK